MNGPLINEGVGIRKPPFLVKGGGLCLGGCIEGVSPCFGYDCLHQECSIRYVWGVRQGLFRLVLAWCCCWSS